MAKNPLQRYLPSTEKLRENRMLRRFGESLFQPILWKPSRRATRKGAMLGLFWATPPIPLQMVIVAALCIRLKANIPLALSLVWVTNPITIAPLTFLEYKIGSTLLARASLITVAEMERMGIVGLAYFLLDKIAAVALPTFLGALVVGIVIGALGYLLTDIVWRFRISRAWRKRARSRASV